MSNEYLSPHEVDERIASGESLADILADSDYQTKWTNHWDANPFEHGGCFVRFVPDRETFKTVYTEPYTDVIATVVTDIDEIWNESELREAVDNAPESFEEDPYVGYTDNARQNAEELSHGPGSSLDVRRTKGSVQFHILSYYGPYRLNAQTTEYGSEDEYWSILADCGIPTERYK